MTLSTTRELIDDACARQGAVPAFNVITLEHAEAIVEGASNAQTAALLQVSENAIRYHGAMEPLLAACQELATSAALPIAIHLDHLEDAELVDHALGCAAQFGVSSLMFDASKLEYSANVEATASIASRARALGLWVEAELGEIGGKDGAHAPGVRTDPAEAEAFVAATRVDGLAVAVGSSHAMTQRSASIDVGLIERLGKVLDVPLVLHGSSGVPNDELVRAVTAGIRKVNIGTALNIVGTAATRDALEADPTLVDPRRFLRGSRDAMAGEVRRLCALLG